MSDFKPSRYASQTFFILGTPGDWTSVPDDVKEALDTIASDLSGIVGGLVFQGNWDASTNTPDLTTSPPDAGKFWRVSVAGSTDLGGITDWEINDWAVSKGSGAWIKVDNTDFYKTGRQAIGSGATSVAVAFSAAYADTSYSITFTLLNTTDVSPAHFTTIITAKAAAGFTATLSGPTATANYILEWFTKHD
ncbi:hypothetical protein LCGC14_2465090 [marine sediment metagenome]|uniref:Uncharacterized protein n=1 Tax=marine sediment metagenome TaxID=412755 RepID=A0A0F9DP99_9ZZZZ